MGRTKYIATVGPATSSIDVLYRVAQYVDGFRINFSHGDEKSWKNYVELIRKLEEKLGKRFAIIGDLQGPSVRIGHMETRHVGEGDIIIFRFREESQGDEIPVPRAEFFSIVRSGDVVLTNDGRLQVRIVDVGENYARGKVLTSGDLQKGKALVIKGKEYGLPSIGEKDYRALEFAAKVGLDYVAISYVKSPEDVKKARNILSFLGEPDIKIISKIETRSAIERLEEIILESDCVLIARGDLGLHFSLEEVPSIQKLIINSCYIYGKPVIVATQLLESMVDSPVPTRAEVADVYSAALEGVDALLLTDETAIGKHPVEAVKWLKRIAEKSEEESQALSRERIKITDIRDRFALGVVELSENLGAKILIYTKTGITAFRMARFKPRTQIFAASSKLRIVRQLSIIYGIRPLLIETQTYEEGLNKALETLKITKSVSKGDIVVLTYGLREAPMHYVKIISIT
ncbi:MAG: pyruvate kinase [Thermoprotei archaeon]|nr:MAG: pyruvate kinase [Thermoprotei archaeon]RLF02320.1 MAG: pyruvate kinase [Thermoprotei archaeon]